MDGGRERGGGFKKTPSAQPIPHHDSSGLQEVMNLLHRTGEPDRQLAPPLGGIARRQHLHIPT